MCSAVLYVRTFVARLLYNHEFIISVHNLVKCKSSINVVLDFRFRRWVQSIKSTYTRDKSVEPRICACITAFF